MFKKTFVTLLISFCGMGAVMLLPFAGEGAGLNPISSAWAEPNCDADDDGFDKRNRKCGGDDPDDNDACVPDNSDPSCGGTGTGGDLGSAISMDCMLEGAWGDSSGESIKGDGLSADLIGATKYSDAVDKVDCSIDGPSTPWPIRLGMGIKGRPENSVRKVDVELGDFELPGGFEGLSGVDPNRVGSQVDLDNFYNSYPTLFEAAAEDFPGAGYPDMDEMDPIRINVRPYRDAPNQQTADGIHLLDWDAVPYEMGLNFSIPGTERFTFSIAAQHYPGNESFTGIGCETGFENEILANAPGGGMQDVSVYLWLDGADADDLPDGYTVSTGLIEPRKDINGNYLEGPPDIKNLPGTTSKSRYAAVCSSVGPDVCGNPRAPSRCNFLGYVPVQLTLHTRVK